MVGQLGINRDAFFYTMSINETMVLLKEFDNQRKHNIERHREICFYIAAPYLPKHTTIERFMKLPWEKAKPQERMSKQEFNKMIDSIKKLNIL